MTVHEVGSAEWVAEWCVRNLGSDVTESFHESQGMSSVRGLRLEDGREVAVKLRYDDGGRASTCVAVQGELAAVGFPCATPVSPVVITDGVAVHAEEWLPGGAMIRSASEGHAALSGQQFARLMSHLENISTAQPPLPNPVWVQWDYEGDELFPPHFREIDKRAKLNPLPQWLADVVVEIRNRVGRETDLQPVLGHADWEAQNLRWIGEELHVVHDWDSLAWLPEAAVVGAASGAFASEETPTLAPVESSHAFLDAYQVARGRHFSSTEIQVAWAASMFPAAHNARAEYLFDVPKIAWTALQEQAEIRFTIGEA